MAAGYTFSKTSNVTTITHNGESAALTIWGILGTVQLRVTAIDSTAGTAEYRVCQAGVQDIVIPYEQITEFSGSAAPTGNPIADFALFLASFPTQAA